MKPPPQHVDLEVIADLDVGDATDIVVATANRYLQTLCVQLALPVSAKVRIGRTDPRHQVKIGNQSIRLATEPRLENDPAARLTWTLLRGRELLVTEPVARAYWQAWDLDSADRLSFPAFLAILRESVRWGRGVQQLADALPRKLAPDAWLEAALDAAGPPELRLFVSASQHARIIDAETGAYQALVGEDQDFGGMLTLLADGLFYELGALFRVPLEVDASLAEDAFRLKCNDIDLPPRRGLAAESFAVNDNVERLRLLGVEGEAATNPANEQEMTIVRGGAEARETCEGYGLTTWGPEGYIVLTISGELRRNAGAFLTTQLSAFFLDQLSEAFPDLVEQATRRFDNVRITRVLRTLLDEEISVRDLRTTLEALLSLEEPTSADYSRAIVFGPKTGIALPVRDARDLAALTAEEMAEGVRMALRRYISHKYSRGQSTLVVYLLDPDIEERLVDTTNTPLTEDERDAYLRAIDAEITALPASSSQPVILTSLEARRRTRRLIEQAFPFTAVLSYNELSPDMNIQPIARISLS